MKKISTKKIKQMLPAVFIIPQPLRKDEFLQEIEQKKEQGISYREFILIQITYIRKITWCLSFVLLLFALAGTQLMERNMLWYLAAFLPFLAVCGVTEQMRSENYGMAELEMASRFSLRSVMFARLGILSAVHFLLIILLLLILNRHSSYNLLQTMVYLVLPYFMTVLSGLWISRKIHGKESVYACMGAAVMISMLQNILSYMREMIYTGDLFKWWLLALCLAVILTVKEIKTMLMEEIVWNL